MKKKHLTILIPEPCHENWENMSPKEKGRHCDVCNKCVVDFTAFTAVELVHYFANKPQNVCGRFTEMQLNRNLYEMIPVHRRNGWAVAASMLLIATQTAMGQNTQPVKPASEIVVGKVIAPQKIKNASDSSFMIQLKLSGVALDTRLGFTHNISRADQYVLSDSNGVFHLQVFPSDIEAGILAINRQINHQLVDTIYLTEVEVGQARKEIYEINNVMMPEINIKGGIRQGYPTVMGINVICEYPGYNERKRIVSAPYPANPVENTPTPKDPNAKIPLKQSPKVEFGTQDMPGVDPNPRPDR